MSDQNALLRLLAAQQMMGMNGNQGSTATSTRPSTSSSSNLNAAMAGFGALNPQMMLWQNMLLAQQQAQALAMVQAAQQAVNQQHAANAARVSAATSNGNSFDDAMKRLVAAAHKQNNTPKAATVPKKTVPPALSALNGLSTLGTSSGLTPSPAKLEPGEVPKKSDLSLTSSLSTPSPSHTLSTTPSSSKTQNHKPSQLSSLQPSSSSSSSTSNGISNAAMNNALWQLFAQQVVMQQTAKNANNIMKPKKENGIVPSVSRSHDVKVREDSVASGSGDNDSGDHCRRKHIVTDVNAVRKPISYGWRRQTCIRLISANGLRGDVVYYAPCGKKLSTYAEVIRYLQKTGCGGGEITRDHFSFSCKMIVGEFIMIRVDEDTNDKGFVKLSEEEVLEEMKKLMKPKPPPKEKIVIEKVKKEKVIKEEEEEFDHGETEEYESPLKDLDDTKGSRIPIDDLLLEEVRPMPSFPRVDNLSLKGNGFADALMVHEFLLNFHQVLKIDPSTLPSLSVLCAGLAGEEEHRNIIMQVTRNLITLVLEYPGMPRKDTDLLRQQAGELELSRDNYSELLRMFLQSRDKQGQELASHLETSPFEALSGDLKAAILGFLCNELLYCRNIVREIDSSLEEIGRLRGDRWMREGKVRALTAVQKRKVKKTKGNSEQDGERPDSRQSEHSDNSRPASPIRPKVLTPGIGQCEVLTEEEENMSVEELTTLIGSLNSEVDSIRLNVNKMHSKVRTFPLGQDRFHRLYWQLPNVSAVLVESVESCGVGNSAVNTEETCSHDPPGVSEPPSFVHPDVIACVEDLIDGVIVGGKNGKKKRRIRRMENGPKRGWWTVDSDNIKPLRDSLHGRGIRERALHRLLLRETFVKERQWGRLSVGPLTSPLSFLEIEQCELARAERAVREIENRVADFSLQVPTWKPPLEPVDEPEGEEESSRDSWTDLLPSSLLSIQPSPTLDDLRSRLLRLEENIERRYLRQHFHAGEIVSIRKVLGKDERNEEKMEIEDENTEKIVKDKEEKKEEEEKGKEKEEKMEKVENEEKTEEVEAEVRDFWIDTVSHAQTAAKLIICAQVLEQCIGWERSVMKACCQICRTSENEEKLLLCDLCDLGYHLYCFRPILSEVPQGEWYCPKCKETASKKPTCLLCSQQNTPIYGCQKCYSFFHSECSGEQIPDNPRQYKCAACDVGKKTVRVIERDCDDSRAQSEVSEDPAPSVPTNQKTTNEKEKRNGAQKRKAVDVPVVFPPNMTADLARTMLDELESQQHSGPFLEPVNPKEVPEYRKVITHPIDLQTMRDKADSGRYETPEDFHSDVELMFSNCRTFNEDESPIGQCGIQLNKFFAKRWRQVRYNFCKRLKRMRPNQVSY